MVDCRQLVDTDDGATVSCVSLHPCYRCRKIANTTEAQNMLFPWKRSERAGLIGNHDITCGYSKPVAQYVLSTHN